MLVLSINYSWSSQRKTFVLHRLELEGVDIQISTEPYKNYHGKQYKACTVVDLCQEWEQENPEGKIVGLPNEAEWVSEPLFD